MIGCCRYFCQFGYRTPYKTVDYNITCGANGQWSSEPLYVDSHPTQCEPVECPGPPPQAKPNSLWYLGIDPSLSKQFRGLFCSAFCSI